MPEVHLRWFTTGLENALLKNRIVIIVDTLRFSSTVVTAMSLGFTVYPVSDRERGKKLAEEIGGVMSGKSNEARFSLSPHSFLKHKGKHDKPIVLYSPNGGACCERVTGNHIGYIGTLLNARAVAEKASEKAREENRDITVIAAGEIQAEVENDIVRYLETDHRVFALEDFLGAGAIISNMDLEKTGEALVAQQAFRVSKDRLYHILRESTSGQWLVQHDMERDIEHVSNYNSYDIVPVIKDGVIKVE